MHMYQQQNYGYYPTNNIPVGTNRVLGAQALGLKGRPVSSLDEVRATSIDFDGSIFYFPDLSNQKIYTKQINMDGTSTLRVYELSEQPIATSQNQQLPINNLVTKEEFEKTINTLVGEISTLKSSMTNTAAPKPAEEVVQTPHENNQSFKF